MRQAREILAGFIIIAAFSAILLAIGGPLVVFFGWWSIPIAGAGLLALTILALISWGIGILYYDNRCGYDRRPWD